MRCACLSVPATAALILAAAECPFGAQAQQQSLPVVGYLSFTSPDEPPTLVAAFRQGLQQAGFVAGQNVAIEYRSAGGKSERLPALAAELVKIPAAVIAATGGEAVARAAKAATSQIPIVFTSSSDVVKGGLVASLNCRAEMLPASVCWATNSTPNACSSCVNSFPGVRRLESSWMRTIRSSRPPLPQMKAAAEANGQRLVVLDARTEVDIDATFASLRSKGVDALLVTTNPFYEGRRDDIVALAKRHSVPVMYPWREYSVAAPYKLRPNTSWRSISKPLGLTVPNTLIGRADEVIE